MDNAPGHPKDLTHPNVKIKFLPPNTTSLLQPMDQGIIYTFKTYYIRRSIRWILDTTETDSIDVTSAWKKFSIKDSLELVNLSLKEIKVSTLNRCWRKLWPEVVRSNEIEVPKRGFQDILDLAHLIEGEGFDDMANDDLQELFVDNEIDDESLLEIAVNEANNSKSDDSSSEETVPSLTIEKLQEGFAYASNLESCFINADPVIERRLKFKNDLEKILMPYKECYKEALKVTKQSKMTDFFYKEPLKKKTC